MRAKLGLLAAQAVAFGLVCAFLLVPASALFLDRYGSRNLPYVYLVVAVAGLAVSAAMRRAQARVSLATLATWVLLVLLAVLTAAWLIIVIGGGLWVTFPLVVLFWLSIPIGFVLIGAQGGRLLDVRQMKAHFPAVLAGFPAGFGFGGLVAAWLVGIIGGPEHLLAFDVGAAALWVVLLRVTALQFRGQLDTRPAPSALPPPATGASVVAVLRRDRLVQAIFGYQFLSAAVTLLLDFMVWERAAARYSDPTELARFQGLLTLAVDALSLAFVALLAGPLLSRFGLGAGLVANPGGVLVVLGLGLLFGVVEGRASLVFFLFVCAAQVVDLTLTDGMTRTSVNASYQALAPDARLRAQTSVEGAGIALALGFVGALLLLLRALGLGVLVVGVIVVVMTVAWLVLSRWSIREYGTSLRAQFARRAWDPQQLVVADDASQAAVERLLSSPDPRDIRVAVAAVAGSGPHAVAQLAPMLTDPVPAVRIAAAAALVGTPGDQGDRALELWKDAACSGDDNLVAAAVDAAARAPNEQFLADLLDLAAHPVEPAGLVDALEAHADYLTSVLDLVAVPRLARERLIRAVGVAGSPAARAALVAALRDADPDIRAAAARALGNIAVLEPGEVGDLLESEAERAARALAVMAELPDDVDGLTPLRRALRDELADTAAQSAALVGLAVGARAAARAVHALRGHDPAQRALALEMIETSLDRRSARLALALFDPALDDGDRRDRLSAYAPEPADAPSWLSDLVHDNGRRWQQPWSRICALYAAPAALGPHCATFVGPWVHDADPLVVETADWALDRCGTTADRTSATDA